MTFKLHSIFGRNEINGETSGGQNTLLFEDLNQNPLKSAGILSSTINHTQIGSFFDLFDEDLSNSFKLSKNNTSETTSIFTIDLNRIIKSSVTGINFVVAISAGGSDDTNFKIEYSEDNSSFTTWFDTNYLAAASGTYDNFLFNKTYRYLKLTVFTDTTAAAEGSINIKLLKITR